MFDKVIVITDRRVLDEQLSGTVKQFESTAGRGPTGRRGGGAKNKDLADALTTETARIILVHPADVQPVDAGWPARARNYAVIVDEAHSSQTGEAAKDLKAVLGAASEEERLAMAEKEEAGEPVTGEDRIAEAVAARATQKNLSFFAFTATPKARTVELFGTPIQAGAKAPFHVYSMRQAVEEGFILDVLRNYTTFDVFWKVRQSSPGDPGGAQGQGVCGDRQGASRCIEHNVAKRAKIIVDHFREHVAHQLDGHAKAMVVTASRLHAVRYKQAIDTIWRITTSPTRRALVAFSGQGHRSGRPTRSGDGTETSMNTFPGPRPPRGSRAREGFAVDDYQVMIVAEKFQTGFDAPLLHTMYVDKKFEGVNAVQTLARLNRVFPGKVDTFILDFRNDAEAIADGFRPFRHHHRRPCRRQRALSDGGNSRLRRRSRPTDVDITGRFFARGTRSTEGQRRALLGVGPGGRSGSRTSMRMRRSSSGQRSTPTTRAYSFLSQIVDLDRPGPGDVVRLRPLPRCRPAPAERTTDHWISAARSNSPTSASTRPDRSTPPSPPKS